MKLTTAPPPPPTPATLKQIVRDNLSNADLHAQEGRWHACRIALSKARAAAKKLHLSCPPPALNL